LKSLLLSILIIASGCTLGPEMLAKQSTQDVCLIVRTNVGSDNHARALDELTRRGFSQREVAAIDKGTVFIGMSEQAAICSWDARVVGETLSPYDHSRQYWGAGGSSAFFVDVDSGRVDYISS
jgi:hypothetical protein